MKHLAWMTLAEPDTVRLDPQSAVADKLRIFCDAQM
jgi:hypothetical protein